MAFNPEEDPGWKYLRQTRDEMTRDQSKPYDSKVDCWVPHPDEGYIAAQIKEIKGDIATVMYKGGTEVCGLYLSILRTRYSCSIK